ncbi:hypothetical protein CALCODRAFT_457799 [Calocera cornea HHB12733]|uniref:Calcineurin-like phosphoesterase domain-containing protein n=1 Tax=Calocera cornea HHB12733 TaxID=1353952 RepID=A0A165DV88_9BASI|nr:hypothetical protein CALCODRAFT_457799 [Calocera cornea HHB12733]
MSSAPALRIQLLSDVHLEHDQGPGTSKYAYDFPVVADDLALLGDIGNTKDEELFGWIDLQLTRFKRVFYLAGNHEPYGWSLDESYARLSDYATTRSEPSAGRGAFVYLNRTQYDLSPTLTLLGCTLWSALDPAHTSAIAKISPDFKHTANFDVRAYDSVHRADLAWLQQSIAALRTQEPHRQIVVFTHHAPTFAGAQDPKFDGGFAGSVFSTELTGEEWWAAPPLSMWCFGHTHWTCDFDRGGVRVVSNQRGYPSDGQSGFDPAKVVEIPELGSSAAK